MKNPLTLTRFEISQEPLGTALTLKPQYQPQSGPIQVVQLTDCHLGADIGERLAGMDTDESLDQVVGMMSDSVAAHGLDLILATGDLANHESAAAYVRLRDKLDALETPSAWLPGNHDSYDLMVNTVGHERVPKVVYLDNWAILLLDTAVPGRVGGRLGPGQLEKLQQQLAVIDPDANIVVALHHQPVPVGSDWIDEQKVEDGDALFELLSGDERLKAIVWGHVHQDFETSDSRLGGARLMATPSTCIQFAPHNEGFKLHDRSPGYRWINLHSDGRLETGVARLEGVALEQDLQSNGY